MKENHGIEVRTISKDQKGRLRKSCARSLEIKQMIMENNKKKPTEKESPSESALERGKKLRRNYGLYAHVPGTLKRKTPKSSRRLFKEKLDQRFLRVGKRATG